jgi:hypothetical protein
MGPTSLRHALYPQSFSGTSQLRTETSHTSILFSWSLLQ